jgi:hypothetical protein
MNTVLRSKDEMTAALSPQRDKMLDTLQRKANILTRALRNEQDAGFGI